MAEKRQTEGLGIIGMLMLYSQYILISALVFGAVALKVFASSR